MHVEKLCTKRNTKAQTSIYCEEDKEKHATMYCIFNDETVPPAAEPACIQETYDVQLVSVFICFEIV